MGEGGRAVGKSQEFSITSGRMSVCVGGGVCRGGGGGGEMLCYYYITSFSRLYIPFFTQGKSCQDIKKTFPQAQDGMYHVKPDDGLNMFWAYCDMTSFGGGWTMCYSTDNLVGLTTEVTYDSNLPYGTNGYRTDCNNIQVNALKHQPLKNGFKNHGAPLLGLTTSRPLYCIPLIRINLIAIFPV